jgi:hypothetical protein
MHPDELSLRTLRRALAALADPDGGYRVVCDTCDVVPVPADEFRFADPETATTARHLVRLYRGRLRRYDSRTDRHALVVRCCRGTPGVRSRRDRPSPNRNH